MNELDFPLFDGHLHFCQAYLEEAMLSHEECGVRGGINLWGAAFAQYNSGYTLDYAEFLAICRERGLDGRYVNFYWPDYRGFGQDPDGFVAKLCDDLRRYAALGCRGLKVWKDLGMFIRFADGTVATMDDGRLEPVWQTCRQLGFTISIHQADPTGYFEKHCTTGLGRQDLFAIRDRVIEAYPDINFILCHSCNYIESVAKFASVLEKFSNVKADMFPLDRHDSAGDCRAFMEKYADRLYIGTDLGLPQNRPADRKWNLEEGYLPWRRRILSWGLSKEAFDKITWTNGRRDFFGA